MALNVGIEVAHVNAPSAAFALLDDRKEAILDEPSQFPGRDAEIVGSFSRA